MAAPARLAGVLRARITQIMGLLMLAPGIQEEVLFEPCAVKLRALVVLAHRTAWAAQRAVWSSHDTRRSSRVARAGHQLLPGSTARRHRADRGTIALVSPV